MDKVQLGTRIPRSLDAEIESVAKHLRVKKQELVVQLLMYGLVAVKNLQNFSQKDQLDKYGSSSGLAVNSPFDAKSDSVADLFPSTNNFEERIADLESNSTGLSCQLAELNRLMIELHSTLARSPAGFSGASSQAQALDVQILTPTQEQEADNYSTRPVEQFRTLDVTPLVNVNQAIASDTINKGEALLPHVLSSPLSTSSKQEQSNQTVKEEPWLTIKEAFELAKAVGYQKSCQSFRAMMLESANAEHHRLEWGFEFDANRRSSPVTKNRAIRPRQGGRVAHLVQASEEGLQLIDMLSDMSASSGRPVCSVCGRRMGKDGSRGGCQRYRCNQCGRSITISEPKSETS